MKQKTLHIVHCVDTEGPLNETLDSTFERLNSIFDIRLEPSEENLLKIQNREMYLQGKEEAVAKCFSKELLEYNSDWFKIDRMLDKILSASFRNEVLDDYQNGWVFSWHCVDHVGFIDNPRNKEIGYGKIFDFYKKKLKISGSINDEINWHFHPLAISRKSTHCATSFTNSYEVLNQIICRRILDYAWFPVVNRPGFHSIRPDSHLFLEQWIPFDYGNQYDDVPNDQPDLNYGRLGDWSRAPSSWGGYNPHHDDYQKKGECRRTIFRTMNIGTRIRNLSEKHIREAFEEAKNNNSAILAFCNHDYRDMEKDIREIRKKIFDIGRQYSDVNIKFSGAGEAARDHLGFNEFEDLELKLEIINNRIFVKVIKGEVFGPQPFLAIKSKKSQYFHDNFDEIEKGKKWTYVFDDQTLIMNEIAEIGVGAAGKHGNYFVTSKKFNQL